MRDDVALIAFALVPIVAGLAVLVIFLASAVGAL
jgi:hypothetical protein